MEDADGQALSAVFSAILLALVATRQEQIR
jgi:hypothetical protein